MRDEIKAFIGAMCEKENNDVELQKVLCFVTERLSSFTKYFNAVYNQVIAADVNRTLRDIGRIDHAMEFAKHERINADAGYNKDKIKEKITEWEH